MAVIETMAEEVDDTDWTDELSAVTERVMVVADALREDCDLMRGTRRLLTDMDGMPPGLSRRIFEAVAACLLGEAAEQHRKARPELNGDRKLADLSCPGGRAWRRWSRSRRKSTVVRTDAKISAAFCWTE
jgi:hypothetical protein